MASMATIFENTKTYEHEKVLESSNKIMYFSKFGIITGRIGQLGGPHSAHELEVDDHRCK